MRSQVRRWIPKARALADGGWREYVPRTGLGDAEESGQQLHSQDALQGAPFVRGGRGLVEGFADGFFHFRLRPEFAIREVVGHSEGSARAGNSASLYVTLVVPKSNR